MNTPLESALTTEEIDDILADGDEEEKILLAERADIIFKKKQLEAGWTDDSYEVRAAFAKRLDAKPTAKQLERGLTDQFYDVRIQFYNRPDVTLSAMQKSRAKLGSFNVNEPTSMEEYDEPSIICPFCKTWIIEEQDTWCEHVAYVYSPPFFGIGLELGPAATLKYDQWLEGNGVIDHHCSRKKFNLLCKTFQFKKRNIAGADTMGFACGNLTYAFTASEAPV